MVSEQCLTKFQNISKSSETRTLPSSRTTDEAVVFLMSDFIDDDWIDTVRRVNRRHDVTAVLVSDPREIDHAPAGLITLEDAETGARRVVDTSSKAWRDRMRRESARRVEHLRSELRASGIDLIHIDAAGSIAEPLIEFFRRRQRRK